MRLGGDAPQKRVDAAISGGNPVQADQLRHVSTAAVQSSPQFAEYVQHQPLQLDKTDFQATDLNDFAIVPKKAYFCVKLQLK